MEGPAVICPGLSIRYIDNGVWKERDPTDAERAEHKAWEDRIEALKKTHIALPVLGPGLSEDGPKEVLWVPAMKCTKCGARKPKEAFRRTVRASANGKRRTYHSSTCLKCWEERGR